MPDRRAGVTSAAKVAPRRRRTRSAPLPASRGAYPRVHEVVSRIPRGRVATYGQVAAVAGIPHAPRVAGYALHALPPGSPVPWHRVVAAGGRLSLGKLDPAGALTQRLRLEHEGVRLSRHAEERMALKGVTLPETLPIAQLEIIEVTTGEKMLLRFPFGGRDVVVGLTNGGVVTTVYHNAVGDRHSTLDPSKYEVAP